MKRDIVRITIAIDKEIYDELRKIQGKLISETKENWTISRVINQSLSFFFNKDRDTIVRQILSVSDKK